MPDLYHILLLPGIITLVAVYALMAVYAERKVAAWIQDRIGPAETGPYGLLQTAADILKLLQKELVIPTSADKWMFLMAPVMIFGAVLMGYAAIPFSRDIQFSETETGVLYIVSIVALEILGLLMAGWGSNNKYALMGSLRSVSQIISYELPLVLIILTICLLHGSLQLQAISAGQGILSPAAVSFFGTDVSHVGGFLGWNAIRYPHLIIAALIYFLAGTAESNRAPYDIPEAESELVSGYHVEYSGFRFALIMLAEYANMLLISMIAAILFFGGWNTILPNLFPAAVEGMSPWEMLTNGQLAWLTTGTPGTWIHSAWGMFWLLSKSVILVGLQMWLRWTLPRYRADQLMRICWKTLLPASLVLFLITATWKMMEVYYG